jgi:hypothetical protein
MATFDDLPTLPESGNLSLDDLIGVVDLSDRRSPKKVSLSQLAGLIAGGANFTPIETDLDKLLYDAAVGETVCIYDEGDRIEMFTGAKLLPSDNSAILISGIDVVVGPFGAVSVINDVPIVAGGALNGKLSYSDTQDVGIAIVWYADGGDYAESPCWVITYDGWVAISFSDVDYPWLASGWDWVDNPYIDPLDFPEPTNPPVITRAPAANNDNWVVLENTVALTVYNATGSAITINGVECAPSEDTYVGWVDPLNIPCAFGFAAVLTAYRNMPSGNETTGIYHMLGNPTTLTLPFAARPRDQIYIDLSAD